MIPSKKKSQSPSPDIEPIPGSLPKKFPDQPEPLGAGAPRPARDDSDESPNRSGSGEDPTIESGVPDNDPEQPRETDEEKSMQ